MRYRKHLRLAPEIYRKSGYYFVTVVSKRRNNLFVGTGKDIITETLLEIPNRFDGWKVDIQEIMPNHVHTIFENTESENTPLSRVIQAFKSLSYRNFKVNLGINEVIWQRNYFERVIRSEKELEIVRNYIRMNPEVERYDWEKILKEMKKKLGIK